MPDNKKRAHIGLFKIVQIRKAIKALLQGSDVLYNFHMMDMRCVLGFLHHTHHRSVVVDDANGLHHDAFFVSSLRFFFLELPYSLMVRDFTDHPVDRERTNDHLRNQRVGLLDHLYGPCPVLNIFLLSHRSFFHLPCRMLGIPEVES